MKVLRTRKVFAGLTAVLCLTAVGLLAISSSVSAEEGRPRRAPIDPEQAKKIWAVQATCAAGAAGIKGEDAEKVVKAYLAAQEAYAKKVADLPRTRESSQQRRELGEKAAADLKEALTKAVGAEKAGKVIGLLSPFGMMGSRVNRMIGGLIEFKLPKEKLGKAVIAVMENNKEQAKLFAEARESGSFEGVREKMQPLTEALNKKLSAILSEEQMATWKEKYARPFGGRRGPGAGGRRRPE